MADIEAQRLDNLKHKAKLLADLKLDSQAIAATRVRARVTKAEDGNVSKRRKIEVIVTPSRSSARLQQTEHKPSYKEASDSIKDLIGSSKGNGQRRGVAATVKSAEVQFQPNFDVDTIRRGWAKWQVVGSPGVRHADSSFHFKDFPLFRPNKSPEEMVREGAFGGSYWRPLRSRRMGILIEGDWRELPKDWISGLDVHRNLTNPRYDPDVNKYKVSCGQSIEEWEASGWIMHEYDVRGWFQWYCRFFQGRRCPDDDRQVSRWRKCVGPTGRWKRMLLKAYLQEGVRDVFEDETSKVSPVMHQTCHHWAIEIKQHDLDEAWK